LHPRPYPTPAYVRDFRGFKKIRIIGKVKLLEDLSTDKLIAVRFSDSESIQALDGSAAFVREIDASFLLV
jgi:hypothetical protein